MKKFLGILTLLLSIAFMAILVLRIWNVSAISPDNLVRSSATLVLLGITILILIVVYGAFFRNTGKDYRTKSGKQAHPKL